eukprot:JP446753.1.p2 GENE.JP446753.1~~JP446753.1.p2  ORF type:complete len:150 (+),score=23.23 JP446753.1:336-785(+)
MGFPANGKQSEDVNVFWKETYTRCVDMFCKMHPEFSWNDFESSDKISGCQYDSKLTCLLYSSDKYCVTMFLTRLVDVSRTNKCLSTALDYLKSIAPKVNIPNRAKEFEGLKLQAIIFNIYSSWEGSDVDQFLDLSDGSMGDRNCHGDEF